MICPACSKSVDQESQCPRCGTDLSECFALSEKINSTLNRAVWDLKTDRFESSLKNAKKSYDLRHSSIAAKVAFVSLLLNSDCNSLKTWWFRARMKD